MKKWAAVMALASMPVMAADHEVCSIESETAEVIMGLRQEGMPMRDLVDLSKEQGFYDATTQVMVKMAYDRPAAQSEEYKAKQKTEFGNAFYKHCIDR
ncbi:hypothetical protein [Halomonas elongata]|uniref:Uncharacterized protein n=1 Tax=Halomonas elongata (strain ATCC 33173 / DSM 2581 / NBRC 15536 / NCIMB 2198 / 1H9) TaxID=768066 RepID=A0ABZ0T900_HALED|nr:hypothetical protein [Halomonas elongata]WBF19206.1 hypothetical protein LM502_05825 [Halomonas elongata]WPU48066.1 hypothetical protein SR933_04050 [Halomonas elongata DSM 2581]